MAQDKRKKNFGDVVIHRAVAKSSIKIPWADVSIQAGFPSPADDYIAAPIDLNRELIANPASTFLGRIRGDSMIDAGIFDGDLVVVDKALSPRSGDVAVCFIDGEFTIKYIKFQNKSILLIPANKEFSPIRVTADNEFMIWGIVTYSIRRHRAGGRARCSD